MKRLCGIILVFGCLLVPVRAQETGSPEALRAAQDLAAIITGDSLVQMSRTLTAQMWPQIEAHFAGKVDGATLAEVRGEFETTLASFTAEAMKDAPAIYAKYFNAQELRELLAFYHSPIGKKALQTMPTVMADVSTQMMPRMQNFQRNLNAKIEAVMQKHGYKN